MLVSLDVGLAAYANGYWTDFYNLYRTLDMDLSQAIIDFDAGKVVDLVSLAEITLILRQKLNIFTAKWSILWFVSFVFLAVEAVVSSLCSSASFDEASFALAFIT